MAYLSSASYIFSAGRSIIIPEIISTVVGLWPFTFYCAIHNMYMDHIMIGGISSSVVIFVLTGIIHVNITPVNMTITFLCLRPKCGPI